MTFQETIVLAHNKKSALSKRWRVLFSAPITHALAMGTAAGSAEEHRVYGYLLRSILVQKRRIKPFLSRSERKRGDQSRIQILRLIH
jgi:hypothetical protein